MAVEGDSPGGSQGVSMPPRSHSVTPLAPTEARGRALRPPLEGPSYWMFLSWRVHTPVLSQASESGPGGGRAVPSSCRGALSWSLWNMSGR